MAEPATKPAPDATTQPAAPAPQGPQMTADGRVMVRTPDGMVSVPAEQAERFVAEGRGQLATAGDVAARADQREFGEGIGNEVRTALEAGADVATLGGFSAATRAVGGQDAADALRKRAEYSPLAKTTGELATLGTLTLATGGAFGEAAAGAAALSPAGAALRAGVAAERAVSGATALSRIGAMGAAGTVEGVLFGAGQGVQDVARAEKYDDMTAESILAHVGRTAGEGALFGGFAGVAAGGAIESGRALIGRARRALSGTGGKADDASSALARSPTDATAGSDASSASRSSADSSAVSKLDGSGSSKSSFDLDVSITDTVDARRPIERMRDQATAVKRLEAEREVWIRETTKDLTELEEATDILAERMRGGFKPQQVKRALEEMPIENFDATISEAADKVSRFMELVDGMSQDPLQLAGLQAGGGGAGALARVRKGAEGAIAALRGTSDEAFNAMENYKRLVGQARKAARSGPARESLDLHYTEIQQFLEDPRAWGGASKLNVDMNPGWHRKINADEIDDAFLSQAPRSSKADPFRQARAGDTAKSAALFDAIGNAAGDTRVQNLREWVEAQSDFARRAEQAYNLGAGSKEIVARAQKARDAIIAKLKRAERTNADKRAFAELGGVLNDIPVTKSIVVSLKGAASAAADVTASATSKAASSSAASGAASSAAAAAATERMAERVARLESLRRAGDGVRASLVDAGRNLARGSFSAVKTALPAATVTLGATKAARFDQAYRTATEYERDPQAATRRVWNAQGETGRYAPQLAAAQAAKIATAGEFLLSKLPRHDAPSLYKEDRDKPPEVSTAERDEFLRYWRAVNDPLSVVEDVADGRLSTEGVETLRAVYPEIYGQLQNHVLDELAQSDTKPPYKVRLLLGQLLDLPTDSGLDADMLIALQESANGSASQAIEQGDGGMLSPSQRSVPDMASNQMTPTQRLAAR
jgi:hypothetical protein